MLVLITARLFSAHINLSGGGGVRPLLRHDVGLEVGQGSEGLSEGDVLGGGGGDGIRCVYQGVLGGDVGGGGGGGVVLAVVVVRGEVGVVVGVEAAVGVVRRPVGGGGGRRHGELQY